MSKPTTIRLDDTTLARAEAVRVRSQVPITTSAVLQEAVRRGLAELEDERLRSTPWIAFGQALADGEPAEMVTKRGVIRVVRRPDAIKVYCGDEFVGDLGREVEPDPASVTVDLLEFLTPGDLGDTELKFKVR